jgi:hypothetical protein
MQGVNPTILQAAAAPSAVFALAQLASLFGWFDSMPWIDVPFHLAGGLTIAWFFHACVLAAEPHLGSIHDAIRTVCVIGLSAIAAIGWELYEFAVDLIFRTQWALGLPDTLLDLALGVIGATLLPANTRTFAALCRPSFTRVAFLKPAGRS